MKKRIVLLVALVCSFALAGMAQRNPVRWEYTAVKVDGQPNTYAIHITANIEEGWHIYAQHQPKDAIAQPTKILFAKNPFVTFQGKPSEAGKLEKHPIEILGIEQYQYEDKVDFVQFIKLKGDVRTSLNGSVAFQACTDEMCLLPQEIPFTVSL